MLHTAPCGRQQRKASNDRKLISVSTYTMARVTTVVNAASCFWQPMHPVHQVPLQHAIACLEVCNGGLAVRLVLAAVQRQAGVAVAEQVPGGSVRVLREGNSVGISGYA